MRIYITEDKVTNAEDEELDTITILPLVEKPTSHAYHDDGGIFAGNRRVETHLSIFGTDLCIHTNEEYTVTFDAWSDGVPDVHNRFASAKAWKIDGKTWVSLDFSTVYIDGVNRNLTLYVKPGYTAKIDDSKALVNLYKA